MLFILLSVELILLYLLSRWVTQALFRTAYRLMKARSVSISFVTLLLFPGTVIHELAHLFTAEVMGVRTGKLTLVPEAIQNPPAGGEIRTGSVAIAKTDPFRRAIIGLAPLLVGLVALTVLTQLYSIYVQPSNPLTIITISYYYLLFAISNSMFPSSTDMKGVWPIAIVFFVIISAASVAGVHLSLSGQALAIVTKLLTSFTDHLKVVLALNGGLLLLSNILTRLT